MPDELFGAIFFPSDCLFNFTNNPKLLESRLLQHSLAQKLQKMFCRQRNFREV